MGRMIEGVACFALAATIAGCCGGEGAETFALRTDYRIEAENVGEKPVFSWKMSSKRKGAAQTGRRIVVRDLSDGKTVWDSGEVKSGLSTGIAYDGAALKPASVYEWQVTVTDEKGKRLAPAKSIFRTALFGDDAWDGSEWISVDDEKFSGASRLMRGTSCFRKRFTNRREVESARWAVTGLGVFEAYVNGKRVGNDVLKPGFTHVKETRHSFTYDVTELFNCAANATNALAAEVSTGWWADKIVSFHGKKPAFRGQLLLRYSDGSEERIGTDTSWDSAYAGRVTLSSIFEGEDYDARRDEGWLTAEQVKGFVPSCVNREFRGEILPLCGPAITLRRDLALKVKDAYVWEKIEGAEQGKAFGKVSVKRRYRDGEVMELDAGEKLMIDFGQNAAAVPEFTATGDSGCVMKIRVAEMLNDGNGSHARKCDGAEGTLYRANYRQARSEVNYTFAGAGDESYIPTFSFFGYRYLEITATGKVALKSIRSIPVSSIHREDERGRLTTGVKDVNQLISNILWGQYSNYLSVPTDCPQRDERLGWSADTQVFAEAASCNAIVYGFLRKWMGDMRDSQHRDGGYPGVAPFAQYGNEAHRFGWADAGIIVPYVMWKRSGDVEILRENWDSMRRFMAITAANKYASVEMAKGFQWADWLSYETVGKVKQPFTDPVSGQSGVKGAEQYYWRYLGGCYWLWDARMMAEMATALGLVKEAESFVAMGDAALSYLRSTFFKPDGTLDHFLPNFQTALLFASKFGLFESGKNAADAAELLFKNIEACGGCLQTGFLGTSIIMDTITYCLGRPDVAYSLLLQHKNPSWLYSVDQGATTMWERWNSYRKDDGFGRARMNSFNHYAYGAVLSWMYKTMAGIGECPAYGEGGFKRFVLAPQPDRRIGSVDCVLDSEYGVIRSAWRYAEDGMWHWEFTVPANTVALVRTPDGKTGEYVAGTYSLSAKIK